MKGGKNLVQGLEEIIMDDNLFLIKGIKEFIKDYEKDNKKIYLNENMHIKKLYEDKRNTIKFIRVKRKEYKEKISSMENNINILLNTLNDLENERNLRMDAIKDNNDVDNNLKENLEDIIDAISENKKIIALEEDKIEEIRLDYISFNDTSLEEENTVYIFFNYIKREFIRLRREIAKLLNCDVLTEEQLILLYEYLLIITKRMICIEEDILGG